MTRALTTGDSQDRAVAAGMTRIIWSWGTGVNVQYHSSNRGTKHTNFLPGATAADQVTARGRQPAPQPRPPRLCRCQRRSPARRGFVDASAAAPHAAAVTLAAAPPAAAL
eukprot:3948739-Prymnesium_polylepis.1